MYDSAMRNDLHPLHHARNATSPPAKSATADVLGLSQTSETVRDSAPKAAELSRDGAGVFIDHAPAPIPISLCEQSAAYLRRSYALAASALSSTIRSSQPTPRRVAPPPLSMPPKRKASPQKDQANNDPISIFHNECQTRGIQPIFNVKEFSSQKFDVELTFPVAHGTIHSDLHDEGPFKSKKEARAAAAARGLKQLAEIDSGGDAPHQQTHDRTQCIADFHTQCHTYDIQPAFTYIKTKHAGFQVQLRMVGSGIDQTVNIMHTTFRNKKEAKAAACAEGLGVILRLRAEGRQPKPNSYISIQKPVAAPTDTPAQVSEENWIGLLNGELAHLLYQSHR